MSNHVVLHATAATLPDALLDIRRRYGREAVVFARCLLDVGALSLGDRVRPFELNAGQRHEVRIGLAIDAPIRAYSSALAFTMHMFDQLRYAQPPGRFAAKLPLAAAVVEDEVRYVSRVAIGDLI